MSPGPDAPADDAAVSPLELLFDLVFVFTVAQVSVTVVNDFSVGGIARAVVVFVLLFWMYGGYAWLTNAMGTGRPAARAAVLTGMTLLLLASLAVPHAFDRDGRAFGLAYAGLTLVHLLGFWRLAGRSAARAFMTTAGPVNLVGAGLVLAAGWVRGPWDWLLLGAPAVVYAAILATAVFSGGFDLKAGHFAERHEVMIIIALGEFLVSAALVAQEQQVDLTIGLGAVAGVGLVTGLWWTYYAADAKRAGPALAAASGRTAGRRASVGFDLSHLVMVFGIILAAAGLKPVIGNVMQPSSTGPAVVLALGVLLYLVGASIFRRVLDLGAVGWRLLAAAACLVTPWLGVQFGVFVQLVAFVVILAGLGLLEHRAGTPWVSRA